MEIKEAKKNLNRIVQKCKSIVKECSVVRYDKIYRIGEAIPVESIEEVLKELKRKEKIIDEMALEIYKLHTALVEEYGSYETEYAGIESIGKKIWTGQYTTKKKIKKYFENYCKRKKKKKRNKMNEL